MATATLTDQMGAMTLVDDLRHRQMVVQEHLDLPKRREEVAKRIREYYQSQNISFDEALVEQGVRAYFDRRLTFERPKTGNLSRLLAVAYIRRSRWMVPVGAGLLALSVAGAAGYQIMQARDADQTKAVETSASIASHERTAVQSELRQQQEKLVELQKLLSATPLPAGSRMLTPLGDSLAKAKALSAPAIPSQVTTMSREADRVQIIDAGGQLDQAKTVLKGTSATLAEVESLIGVNDRFANEIKAPAYLDVRDNFPILRDAERRARQAIASADQNGVKAAGDAVTQLIALTGDAARVANLTKELRAAIAQFSSMGLSRDEMSQVAVLALAGEAAIKALDGKSAQDAVDRLNDLARYAEIPLTVTIVDRTGVKSGVERRYKESGGKSWFLVAEALDPSGRAVEIPVTSAESGVTRQARVFGVRVSQEEYEKVKADKKSDGHIDERQLGAKPAKSLTIRYGRGIADKPDLILEW